jgi:tetratricopeptide (TPR) repeat protein
MSVPLFRRPAWTGKSFQHLHRKGRMTILALAAFLSMPLMAGFRHNTPRKQTVPDLTPQQQEMERVFQQGVSAYNRDEFVKALSHWQTGMQRAETLNDDRFRALFLNVLGAVYTDKGELNKAEQLLERALIIRERLQDKRNIATVRNNLGRIFMRRGDYGKAALRYKEAAGLYAEIGEVIEAAHTFNNLGVLYDETGHFETSMTYHRKAMACYETAGSARDIADSLHNIGNVHVDMGQFEEGRRHYEKALERYGIQSNELGRAQTLNDLANLYDTLGQYDLALQAHSEALGLKEKIGNPQSTAHTLNNLGAVYEHLGQLIRARDLYQEALKLRLHTNNPHEVAGSYSNLAGVAAKLGDLKKAFQYADEAMKRRLAVNNKSEIALSYQQLCLLHFQSRQLDRALENGHHALNAFRAMPHTNPEFESAALSLLGAIYATKGNLPAAEKRHREALAIRLRSTNSHSIAASYDALASLALKRNRLKEAEVLFHDAQSRYETVLEQVGDPVLTDGLGGSLPRFYARYADLLRRTGRSKDALLKIEAGRTRAIALQSLHNRVGFGALISPADAQTMDELLQEVVTTSRLCEAARVNASTDPTIKERLAGLTRRHERARLQHQSFQKTLWTKYPVYGQLRGERSMDWQALHQLALRNPSTLYLEWAVCEDHRLLVFALSAREGLKTLSLTSNTRLIKELLGKWRRDLTGGRNNEIHSAEDVSRLLIRPLEKAGILNRSKYQRLVIVPSEGLATVPFAALRLGSGRRLIEDFAVSNAFSLGMLLWAAPARKPEKTLLCIADPVTRPAAEQRLTAYRGDVMVPLRHTRTEAQSRRC